MSEENQSPAPSVSFMTVADYAKYKGVTVQTVYARIRDKVIKKNKKGLIEVAEADKNWHTSSNRFRITGIKSDETGTKPGGNINDVLDDKEKLIRERARKEALIAEKEEINVAKLKETVIDKEAAQNLIYSISKQNLESWLLWPNQVALEMASELEIDPALLKGVLDREVRKQLETVATLRFDLEALSENK